MTSLKHVGRVASTQKRVIVAFRTLPGDAYNCLIIPTENLDDNYHNALINLVEGPSGQDCYEFAEALDRTQFPDGSRMLPSLHAKGLLLKFPTDQIEMVPQPGVTVLLSELNQIISEQRNVPVDELSIKPANGSEDTSKPLNEAVSEVASDVTRTTSGSVSGDEASYVEAVVEVAEPVTFKTKQEEATFYRSKADKLAKEAASLRRQAEDLVPVKRKK